MATTIEGTPRHEEVPDFALFAGFYPSMATGTSGHPPDYRHEFANYSQGARVGPISVDGFEE
jgi:hypothetical protein